MAGKRDVFRGLSLDPERLSLRERAEVERLAVEPAKRLAELRTQTLELERERDRLREEVKQLSDRNAELESAAERIETDEAAVPSGTLLSAFERTMADLEERDRSTGFGVDRLSIDLKASVVADDEDVRFRLPTLAEEVSADRLSTVRFAVTRRDADEGGPLIAVPDLYGLPAEEAERRIRRAGLSVGDVESVAGPEGRVLDQLPGPDAVAESEAPIDLTVGSGPAEAPDAEEATGAGPTHGEAAVDAAVRREDRERRTGGPNDGATGRGDDVRERSGSEDRRARDEAKRRWVDADEAALRELERLEGVGPTYADRLREAGVETLFDVAKAPPERLAEASGTTLDRAQSWREQARWLLGGSR